MVELLELILDNMDNPIYWQIWGWVGVVGGMLYVYIKSGKIYLAILGAFPGFLLGLICGWFFIGFILVLYAIICAMVLVLT